MDFQFRHIFQLNHPPMFAVLRANKGERRQKSDKNVGNLQTKPLNLLAEGPRKKEKRPLLLASCCQQLFASKAGFFGDPGAIRTRDIPLRRTRVVLFVHLVSFDFLSFHLDLSRNSASFPKRQTGLIVGFVWLFRTPLLAEFQLFPIPRKPAIPSLPQGKEMQSRKERLALLCPAAFFCT